MADLMAHIRALSVTIGPRQATTPSERRAALYVEGELRRWTANVRIEPFLTHTSFGWIWIPLLSLALAGVALAWLWPWAGALLTALALGMAVAFLRGSPDLSPLLPRHRSQNVVAIMRPRSTPRRRLAVVAHLDTTRAGLIFSPRMAPSMGRNNLASFIILALLAAASLTAAALGPEAGSPFRWAATLLALALLPALGLFLQRELVGQVVHGANDNASGVAVALGLAESLAENPLQQTEVMIACTGAEEVGLPMGAMALLRRHRQWLQGADVIVVDNVGQGRLALLPGEGSPGFRPCDPGLAALARELGAENPHWELGAAREQFGQYTDALPFLRAGIRTLAFFAVDAQGRLPNWHWPTDVIENVDPRTVAHALALVRGLADRLDQAAQPAASRTGG